MLRLFVNCLLLILCYTNYGQNPTYVTKKNAPSKALKYYENGVSSLESKEIQTALRQFEKATEKAPNFFDAWTRLADCQRQLGQIEQAESNFLKAYNLCPNCDSRIVMSLSKIYWNQDKFSEAVKWSDTYLQGQSKNEFLILEAKQIYRNSIFAIEAVKHPLPFRPQHLGNLINTVDREYFPMIFTDDSTLVFTRNVSNKQEDLFISHRREGIWQLPLPIVELNSPDNEATSCITGNGSTLIFTAREKGKEKAFLDLFISQYKDSLWSAPVNMGLPVNSPYWDAQPTVSGDGTILIFASARLGTKGEEDLWISFKDSFGKWSVPENLGDSINTPLSEIGPYLHPDGQTLYFVSEGHPGMGGTDLFVSKRLGKNKWATPKNLGFPINSKRNEGPLTISLNGKTAYFSADYDSKSGNIPSVGSLDIYTFELPESLRPTPVTFVQVSVMDAISGLPLDATVILNHPDKNEKIATTVKDGSYWASLQLGERYSLTIHKEGYLFYSDFFDLKENPNFDKPYLLQIKLYPLKSEKAPPIVLKNIFFNTGSAELLKSSDDELNQLTDLLLKNPTLQIQINGHTDNVGDTAFNQRLSESRAKAVYDYLIQQKIASNRLKYKGFGALKPIADNSTPQGKSQNRRTEFEIVGEK